ncbi:MAG: hypothetical protein SV760_07845 [Halobacteria archaeon]|nr:hypothetical protein [Halobacteria archaeon]
MSIWSALYDILTSTDPEFMFLMAMIIGAAGIALIVSSVTFWDSPSEEDEENELCPVCYEEVSESAGECPSCGKSL